MSTSVPPASFQWGDVGHQHARVIDRELYLPQGWMDDPARCRAAGVPDQVGFATKPELARVMPQRALEAGVPAGWVTADEVYGASPALRGWLETRAMPFVLAVKCTEPLPSPSGPPVPAARLAEHVPPACWLRSRADQGAKGAAGMDGLSGAGHRPVRRGDGSAGCWYAAAFAPGTGVLPVRRPGQPAAGCPGPGRRDW